MKLLGKPPASDDREMMHILREFDAHYRSHVQEELPDLTHREDKLRVSGFPYCGLRHLYRRLHPTTPKTNFGGAYYTGVGHVAHEAIQRWLGYSNRMLGRWICSRPKCKGVRPFSFKNVCPKCGSEMLYVEFEVEAMKHISGHLDGIYRSKDGRYFLIDYKTSSVRVISTNYKTKMLPYGYNVAQITAYCFHPNTWVLTEQGMIKIQDLVHSEDPPKVASFNHEKYEVEYKPILAASEHSTEEDMYEIEYEGGVVRVTENHELWSVTRNSYVKAKDLLEGEDVLVLPTHVEPET